MSTRTSRTADETLVARSLPRARRLLREIACLCDEARPAPELFAEVLRRLLLLFSAPAGGIWTRSPQGRFVLESQINLPLLALRSDVERQAHEAVLQQAAAQARPLTVPAQGSGSGLSSPGSLGLLLAPVHLDDELGCLIEVRLLPLGAHDGRAAARLIGRLTRHVARYLRDVRARQLAAQQRVWEQLEAFARQVQATLDPTRLAYVVANTGRSLIGCDRLSVVLREGRRFRPAAISGAENVENRSRLIVRLRTLAARVATWGERLVYHGARDESLPPAVGAALDEYLAESNSRLLVLQPLVDGRQRGTTARSVLVLECFEAVASEAQLLARLDAVGRLAVGGLYNAVEYRRVPLRWFWLPLASLRDGLGGPAQAIVASVVLALAAITAALVLVPYPLKVEGRGQLLPQQRRWIYSPVEGQVVRFEAGVEPGAQVAAGQALVLMHDLQLEIRVVQLLNEIAGAQHEIEALAGQQSAAIGESERLRLSTERKQREFIRDRKAAELRALEERTNADRGRPGHFWLKAPQDGCVLNWDFREKLTSRLVRPSEPLLRLGDRTRPWEVELRVPQRHAGQVLRALETAGPGGELDVDLLLVTLPTRVFKGKLARADVGGEIRPEREAAGDDELGLVVRVRIDGPDLPPGASVPPELLVNGAEAHARVRCGNRALGYAIFYGVWEFACEKVFAWF